MPPQPKSVGDAPSRPLGNLEGFFKMLADGGKLLNREHWTIHTALRLAFHPSVTDPAPLLRRSWEILWRQHPALGATITAANGEGPRLTAAQDTHESANSTFKICSEIADSSELFSSLCSTPTATCYFIQRSSEVVIRSSHWRTDGLGMAILCHDFMKALASVIKASGDRHGSSEPPSLLHAESSLAPTLEQLARAQSRLDIPSESTKVPVLEAGADALVAQFLRGVPSIGLPTKAESADAVPGSSGRSVMRLGAKTTAELAAACRDHRIKMTSAIHAAIVRVAASFPQHPLCKSYAAFVPVDLRRALEATATDETRNVSKVVGLYFSGLPVCVEQVVSEGDRASTIGFDTIARSLDATYSRDLVNFWESPDGQTVGLLDLAQPYLERTTQLFGAPVPEGLPPVQTPDLSSLGKIDSFLQTEYGTADEGKAEVMDFWIGTEMLNRSVQFHTWSWKGEFVLGACFNQSFYGKDFVDGVLNKVVHELQAGLNVVTSE
ncbi:hypothetical protein PFICI_13489 [Pestalotiopsis fici W106-1]|uniref:Condensation domain-containing protein n=1 Tax=Pestalotiopsis fici (strain W106-1 / CGMCC3.15140) TaxID=1229662 RepID=W3WM50_PESFW|nr:uncharacterized protein PFICI_13489 [Pestalotiopsis fici W106-1]ETS75005.1 hypothetical protein PFICI_13489 [Pestalotiopsis fici W106-1]